MWTTVPQNVFYRLNAWNVVSTPLRASNLCLEIKLQLNIYTSPCFRTMFNTNAAFPGKGRDSVKLTALSTVIPETPRTKKGTKLLEDPTNVKNSTKMEASKTVLNYTDKNKRRKQQSMQKNEARRNTETKQTI